MSRTWPTLAHMSDANLITEELCLQPRLRIALVTETYPPEINGVAITLGRMVNGLLARGHQVQLVRPRQTRQETPVEQSDFEEQLVSGMSIPRYAGLRFGLPARNALVRRWSLRRPDVVHVATEGPLGWSAISAARRLKLPVTSDFHTNFDHYSEHYGLGWLRQPVSTYLRRFHNRTVTSFVPSSELALRLRESGYRNVEVIARGVDCTLFSPARRSPALRREWGLAPEDPAVLLVGRLAPEKNLELALRSFEAIRIEWPRARLVIVGDGPSRSELEWRCPGAIFAGMRSGEDLAAHYASADLFLFPSLTETYGNVTLEAMASGLAVVAFNYAAAREVIHHGSSGLLAPVADEERFVALARKLAGDTMLCVKLGRAARECVRALDWERIHDAFAESLARAARPVQIVELSS